MVSERRTKGKNEYLNGLKTIQKPSEMNIIPKAAPERAASVNEDVPIAIRSWKLSTAGLWTVRIHCELWNAVKRTAAKGLERGARQLDREGLVRKCVVF